jgi:chemotaxis protein MotA
MGVWVSYGFAAPIASLMKAIADEDLRYLLCLKGGIVAYMQGYAPIMAVESARMLLQAQMQPSFADIEAAIEKAPAVG